MLSRVVPACLRSQARGFFKIGKSPRRDEVFLVPIEGVDKEGNGVVEIQWETRQKQIAPTRLLVRGALPGETVQVRVVSVFSEGGSAVHTVRAVLFGRRERLIRPRIDSEPWRSSLEPELLPTGFQESNDLCSFACPHFDRRHDELSCSGCTVPHLHYSRQITEKTRLLRSSLAGAVDAQITVEPRSQITRYSEKFEVIAFANRPLEQPRWGQASFNKPLPGERANFVETPGCLKISKSAQTVLNRLSDLVAVAHAEEPESFSVFDQILGKGYLRSAIFQSVRNAAGEIELLLTLVTARECPSSVAGAFKAKLADRLVAEFPLLKGVVLMEARPSGDRDREFILESPKVLAGQSYIETIVADRRIQLGSKTQFWDSELARKIVPEIVAATGNGPVAEFFPSDGSLTKLLRETGVAVTSGQLLLEDAGKAEAEISASNEAKVIQTAVISFPNEQSKAMIKGVTPKQFRHWLGNVLKPNRIVMVTDRWDGLRKDIGHMKLLGYELRKIRAFDSQPGNMDGIVVLVVMEKKGSYDPLRPEQLIE